jgi:hypothetical protein
LSLGLIGEMLTSQHAEKSQAAAKSPSQIRDVLR